MNEEIRNIIGPQVRGEIRVLEKEIFKKEGVWRLVFRELTYKGIRGGICYYYDGVADHILFVGFPLGNKWNKLARSLQALKRERRRGQYEVEIGEEEGRAKVSLVYLDRDYFRQPGRNFQETRFGDIWQDLGRYLPDEGVVLGQPEEIKDFTLQNLNL